MKNISISQPIISDEEIAAVVATMKSGTIVQWPEVKRLEESFAKLCGTKYAVAFNSGTAALHAGLYWFWVKDGDEVITTPFTFVASANPILMQQAKVVFVDISEEDFLIDINKVEEKISPRTKAIIPVSLYGQVYDYKKLKSITIWKDIKILEDACQSVWASQNGIMSGKCGHAWAFSLYATKNIMCGEGGILVTDDEEIADRARMLRHHGQSEKTRYQYFDIGYNYRLPDILAAIGNVQFSKLPDFTERRQHVASLYLKELKDIKGLILPKINTGNTHVFHQFVIRITPDFPLSREELIAKLKEEGIGTNIYYPKPLHLHPHFEKMGYKLWDFPVAEKMALEVLALPVHPSVTEEEAHFIIETLKKYGK